eukprot:COSAG02_NODE_3381_length_6837_cov_83.054022_1_plen_167_part_00
MYRTSQVYSDGSNPNARWSQNHLVKELSKTLSEDSRKKLYVCGRLPPLPPRRSPRSCYVSAAAAECALLDCAHSPAPAVLEQVGNLHFKATEYQVVKLFQEHGKIKREQFMYHRGGAKKGEPRGVMYVEYETEEEAAAGKSFASRRLCPLLPGVRCRKLERSSHPP